MKKRSCEASSVCSSALTSRVSARTRPPDLRCQRGCYSLTDGSRQGLEGKIEDPTGCPSGYTQGMNTKSLEWAIRILEAEVDYLSRDVLLLSKEMAEDAQAMHARLQKGEALGVSRVTPDQLTGFYEKLGQLVAKRDMLKKLKEVGE